MRENERMRDYVTCIFDIDVGYRERRVDIHRGPPFLTLGRFRTALHSTIFEQIVIIVDLAS